MLSLHRCPYLPWSEGGVRVTAMYVSTLREGGVRVTASEVEGTGVICLGYLSIVSTYVYVSGGRGDTGQWVGGFSPLHYAEHKGLSFL